MDFVQCQVLARTLVGRQAPSPRAWRFDLIVDSTEKRRSWPVGKSVLRSFAGACWSCGGLADWSLIPSGFGECCSRHTFARSFKASSSGFPQVRISIAKFACSFTHFATAASASCNQDGEVLLSSSQPCLSASESSCSNLVLRARSLSISASLPATCSPYAWSMASEMESASSWMADKTE